MGLRTLESAVQRGSVQQELVVFRSMKLNGFVIQAVEPALVPQIIISADRFRSTEATKIGAELQ